jgi:hypothetical protein
LDHFWAYFGRYYTDNIIAHAWHNIVYSTSTVLYKDAVPATVQLYSNSKSRVACPILIRAEYLLPMHFFSRSLIWARPISYCTPVCIDNITGTRKGHKPVIFSHVTTCIVTVTGTQLGHKPVTARHACIALTWAHSNSNTAL